MTGIRNEKELLRALSSLPREIAPGNDVWPQIRQRIGETQQRAGGSGNRWWPAAIAASLVVVLLGGLVLKPTAGPQPQGQELTANSQNPMADEPRAALGVNARLMAGANTQEEQEYQAAFREFLAFPTDPQTTSLTGIESIGSGWATLQEAETELELALRQNPENRVLNSRMTALRARQLDLLQQIAAMEMASRRNNT
jgi:hypothetical protein